MKPRKAHLPAFIRAFIDLSALPADIIIRIPESGQNIVDGKMYALVNTFSAVDADTDCPNAMVGLYKVDCPGPRQNPTLYLVQATSIATLILGIRDVGNPDTDHWLFLFRTRRVEWPGAWDSIIEKCCRDVPSAEVDYGEVAEDDEEGTNSSPGTGR